MYIFFPVDAKLDTVGKAIGVADKAMDYATKLDKVLTKKLDAHFNRVAVPPPKLIGPDAVGQIAKEMKSGEKIEFKEMPGFTGVDTFQLPGWSIRASGSKKDKEQPTATNQPVCICFVNRSTLLRSCKFL